MNNNNNQKGYICQENIKQGTIDMILQLVSSAVGYGDDPRCLQPEIFNNNISYYNFTQKNKCTRIVCGLSVDSTAYTRYRTDAYDSALNDLVNIETNNPALKGRLNLYEIPEKKVWNIEFW